MVTGTMPRLEPRLIGQKPVADFPQGILSGDLRIQAGQELPPCGEMLVEVV